MSEVFFMPWAGLGESFKFGKVLFWPFDSGNAPRVEDKDLRKYLRRYFGKYKGPAGKVANTVVVLQHDKHKFGDLSDDRVSKNIARDYKIASDVVLFACVGEAAVRAIMKPPGNVLNSEKFGLYEQSIDLTTDDLSVGSGYVSYLVPSGKVKFQMPWSVSPVMLRQPHEALLAALDRALITRNGEKERLKDYDRRKLLRCLEWFRLSQTHASEMTEAALVVMLASAFECLLLPVDHRSGSKKEPIAEWIRKRASFRDESATYADKDSPCSAWIKSVYDIRNDALHGSEIKSDSYTTGKTVVPHTLLGAAILWHTVIAWLLERDCFELDHEFAEIADPKHLLLLSKFPVKGLYRKLGWLEEA